MSAGNFTNTFVQSALLAATYFFGKVQPETETFNAQGTVNSPPVPGTGQVQLIPFTVSKGDNTPGFRPAMVYGYFDTSVPTGYQLNSPLRIPLLNLSMVAACQLGLNTSGGNSYQSHPFFITGYKAEDLN